MADSHDADELISSEDADRGSSVLAESAEPARPQPQPQQIIQPESTDSVANVSSGLDDRQEFSGDSADYDMTCKCLSNPFSSFGHLKIL